MVTINDFNLVGNSCDIELSGSKILDYDLNSLDNFYMSCYLYNDIDIFMAISCYDLDTDVPVYELITSYTGSDIFAKVESFSKPDNIKTFILNMIDRINNNFNEEAYDYFISDKWLSSDVFGVISKYDELTYSHINAEKYNAVVGKLGDCSDFEIDSNFKKQYTKHMMFKPDEYITLDMDAFFFDRVIKIVR